MRAVYLVILGVFAVFTEAAVLQKRSSFTLASTIDDESALKGPKAVCSDRKSGRWCGMRERQCHKRFMKNNCKETCGLCDPDDDEDDEACSDEKPEKWCELQKRKGRCSGKSWWAKKLQVKKKCKNTCGLCPEEKEPEPKTEEKEPEPEPEPKKEEGKKKVSKTSNPVKKFFDKIFNYGRSKKTAEACEGWCATSWQSWSEKCTWYECEGCEDCKAKSKEPEAEPEPAKAAKKEPAKAAKSRSRQVKKEPAKAAKDDEAPTPSPTPTPPTKAAADNCLENWSPSCIHRRRRSYKR